MAGRKVDFDIELEGQDVSVEDVKAGNELSVVLDGATGRLRCSTAAGVALGAVPQAAAAQLHGSLRVTVRSVKRRPDAPDRVAGVQARATPAADGGQQQPGGSQHHHHHHQQQQQDQQPQDDPSGYAATVSQLQRLDDPGVVLTLQDERLQEVLLRIDGAPDREKALEHALGQEAFRKFADQVLAVMADKPGGQQ